MPKYQFTVVDEGDAFVVVSHITAPGEKEPSVVRVEKDNPRLIAACREAGIILPGVPE